MLLDEVDDELDELEQIEFHSNEELDDEVLQTAFLEALSYMLDDEVEV